MLIMGPHIFQIKLFWLNSSVCTTWSDIWFQVHQVFGGYQLEFISISWVIIQMIFYKFSAFISSNYSICIGEQILLRMFFKMNFSPMRALEVM